MYDIQNGTFFFRKLVNEMDNNDRFNTHLLYQFQQISFCILFDNLFEMTNPVSNGQLLLN